MAHPIQSIVHIQIDNPVLARLVTEQLSTLKHIVMDKNSPPDCIVVQNGSAAPTTSDIPVLECPKGAIRLGEIIDRLGYILSGRAEHIEDDHQSIDLGEFILFPATNTLVHKTRDTTIRLTDKERLLLRFLFEASPHGLHRKDILKLIWGYADDAETHTLETHIYRLRQKLEFCDAQNLIQVQDGIYRLNLMT